MEEINKDYMIHLDLYTQACEAEFYFNDVPVRKMDQGETFHSLNAHHLLLDGENTLEILINPGPSPSKARQPCIREVTGQPKACVKLVKYPVGAYPGDTSHGEIIMQLNWEYDESRDQSLEYPLSKSYGKNLGEMFGPWLWQQCELIDLPKEAIDLERLVKQLYVAFVQGDAEKVVAFCEPSLKDIGRALPAYGEAEFREDMKADIGSNRAENFDSSAYDAEQVDLRVCGAGKLVQLIDKNWLHTLRTPVDNVDDQYELPLFIGKQNGKWRGVL